METQRWELLEAVLVVVVVVVVVVVLALKLLSPDSSANLVTRLWDERNPASTSCKARHISHLRNVHICSEVHAISYWMGTNVRSSGVKKPASEAEHSPLSSG